MSFIFFFLLMITIIVFILPSVFMFSFFFSRKNNIGIVINSVLSKFANELNNSRNYTYDSNMSKDEAFKILGLNSEANHDEINNAYLNLMKLLHPDKGGSAYFAQKLNEARERLLKK